MRVVVLPGMDGTGKLLAPLAAALPADFELVPLTYPADERLSYQELAERLAKSLPTEGEFVLVGESFAGPLALRIAASKPRGLVGVVLVGSFLTPPISALTRMLAYLVRPVLFSLPLPGWAVRWLLVGRDAPGSLVADVRRAVRSVRPGVLAHRLAEVLTVDVRSAFTSCPVPLLWISGSRDNLLRRPNVEQLRSMRPDVEARTIEAPHFILQRAPDHAARAIEEFIGRVLRSR